MTSTQPGATSHRTYGNWRRPASAGLGSLGALGTGLLLLGLIAVAVLVVLTRVSHRVESAPEEA